MYVRKAFVMFVLFGLTVNVHVANAALSGKVTNQAGQAVPGVAISLLKLGISTTSGADGTYLLVTTDIKGNSLARPERTAITLNNNMLNISLAAPSQVKIEIFNANGTLVHKEVVENAPAGMYRYTIAGNPQSAKLLVIRASVGKERAVFNYVPVKSGVYSKKNPNEIVIPIGGNITKVLSVNDTLRAVKTGYLTKSTPVASYDQVVNITLDTANSGAVTVRLDQERQTIQGFGINATIMPSGKTLPWNQLFTLEGNNALGLSILRIGMNENGGHRDVPSDWTTARTLGAKIIGSCWSAPATWKTNNSVNGGGFLKPEYYSQWATRIADYAKTNNLYAMSVANEADFASGTEPPRTGHYPSMVYTGKQMAEFVKVAGPIFKQRAPGVKLIAPEASLWIHVWSNISPTAKDVGLYNSVDPLGCGCFSNDITPAALAQCAAKCNNGDGYDYGHWLAKDTAAWNAVDILGVHEYESQKAYAWPDDVTGGVRTKEVWQTEMSGVMYWPEQGPSTHIENGLAVARWIQSALTIGEASAWCYWWYEAYYANDNEGLALIQGSSTIAKRYYTMGNYSRYIRPGHKIVNITGTDKLPAKVLLTASKAPDGKVVIVAVNETASAQTVPITIAGGTVPTSMTPIVTSATENWASKAAVPVTNGTFTAALAAKTVTTFIGQ